MAGDVLWEEGLWPKTNLYSFADMDGESIVDVNGDNLLLQSLFINIENERTAE